MTDITTHRYDNGLTLVIEPIKGMKSLAMDLRIPAGVNLEKDTALGSATTLADMVFRGAGQWSAREHSDALDRLGVRRDASVMNYHSRLSATLLGDKLKDAAPLLMAMIREPHLNETNFEPARDLSIQAIDALEDEPQSKVKVELRKLHLPAPHNRSRHGDREQLTRMTVSDIQDFHTANFKPGGAIFGLAGDVDPQQAIELFGELTADWQGQVTQPTAGEEPAPTYQHIHAPSSQQHIALAYPTIIDTDPMGMAQKISVGVLSGGMSGRLFTEVREKRGLCYAVFAAYATNQDRGFVMAYSGTTTERAEQTLEVLAQELHRMKEGVTEAEYGRAVVGLKSRLVMQGESTGARASAIVNDIFHRGKARSLQDINAEIDATNLNTVNTFLQDFTIPGFTIINVGPQPLESADEIMKG